MTYKATIFLKHGLAPIVLPEINKERADFLFNIDVGREFEARLGASNFDPRIFNINQEAIVYIVIEALP